MPYVKMDTRGPVGYSRTVEISTHDPRILAQWLMEQVGMVNDPRTRTEITIIPLLKPTGPGPTDYVADWPQQTPNPFVATTGDVPAKAFVIGLRAALEAFLETL